MKILLVDDDEHFVDAVSRNLRNGPWEILCASSGEEALRRVVDDGEIDILATDFTMPPGMDGAQLISQAVALRPDLYTIVFTGFEEREIAIRALRAGADDFLDKSTDIDEKLSKSFAQAIRSQAVARIRRDLLHLDDDQEILLRVFRALRRVFFPADEIGKTYLASRDWGTRVDRVQQVVSLGAAERLGEKEVVSADSAYSFVLEHRSVYFPPIFLPDSGELSPRDHGTSSIMVVPLTLRSYEHAALGLEHPEDREFKISDLNFLRQIADWVSIAMEKLTNLDRAELEKTKGERNHGLLARSLLHELKTPLNNLSTAVQVVLETVESDELGSLEENINKINQVVDRFLQPLIQHEQAPEPVDLPSALQEAVNRIRVYDRRRTVRVVYEVPRKLPPVLGNRDMLVAALVNLMENAAEAAGPTGWIQVGARALEEHEQVEILIEDDGVGIAESQLDKIFEYGYTTGGDGHFGYGLALTRDIVATYAGRISVASTPGEGSTFRLTFPCVAGN